jgi:hypothetical protein
MAFRSTRSMKFSRNLSMKAEDMLIYAEFVNLCSLN